MKDITIEGRPERVFPLRETEKAIVYIPIKKLLSVDYQRLRYIERQAENRREGDTLLEMRDTTASNGENMLVLYRNLIEVMYKEPPTSIFKNRTSSDSPSTIQREYEEAADGENMEGFEQVEEDEDVIPRSKQNKTTTSSTGQKRGPGRPPKNSS